MRAGRISRRRGAVLPPAAGAVVASLALAACGAGASVGTGPAGTGTKASTSTPQVKPVASTTTVTTDPVHPVHGKVTVLEIGDSLGVDLGWGLGWALSTDSSVKLVPDAKVDSGLVDTAFYDWPSVLQSELQATHPQIVVVFLGANDTLPLPSAAGEAAFGTTAWRSAYAERVGAIMNEATAAGAKVLWVGMPIMRSHSLSAKMATVNAVYRAEAARHKGVTYFSSWNLFATEAGAYSAGTTDVAGTTMPLRDGDGIHLADGGADLLGATLAKLMRQIYLLP